VDDQGTDLRERIASFYQHRTLIIVAVVVTTFGAVAYSLGAQTSYSATSRVVVRPVLVEGAITPQDAFDSLQDPFGLSALIDTQVEVVLSRGVTDDVLEIEAHAGDPRPATLLANAYATAFIEVRRDVVRDALLDAVEALDRRIVVLNDRAEAVAGLLATPQTDERTISLEAELRSVTETLASLVTEQDQRALEAETVSGGGEIVRQAASASSSGPTPLRDGAVGVFLGLAFGLGLALVRSNTDRRIFTLDSAARATGVEVLAAIPKLPARTSKADVHVRVFGTKRADNGAEGRPNPPVIGGLRLPFTVASSLSILREALVARGLGTDLKRVVLVSPGPGEGSAFATAGLAWACAQAGFRTIAVDGAVGLAERQPLFGSRAPDGLGRILAGRIGLTDALMTTSVPGLRFLPAGPPRQRHDDALASARPGAIVDGLARRVDIVVIRSAALSSGGDASAWASEADAILLVLRSGASAPGSASRAARTLLSLGLPLLGVVLTEASAKDGSVGLLEHYRFREDLGHTNGETRSRPAVANEADGATRSSLAESSRRVATRRRRR
jgi:Mrp family chromosome partitioning ATPase/capsular polysaccharide biosynthesis protein